MSSILGGGIVIVLRFVLGDERNRVAFEHMSHCGLCGLTTGWLVIPTNGPSLDQSRKPLVDDRPLFSRENKNCKPPQAWGGYR